ncbi:MULTISPECIES: response regulator [Bacillaceae]|uniref:response regulator n=1 Tax=Bacillaceae TaxID=186817 RepID=UPI001C581493|nr:response regulator [Rossellomorea sp. YZS02]MBW3112194.1 response regulator [Bacillus sp. MCCB 382]MDX8342318.1 response regulator [Rossellomorea sp. YZS02]
MIRIVMTQDEELLLGTIATLLNLEEDMEVVGRATNREHTLELIRKHQPDLLILDIENLLRDGPLEVEDCRILVLATFAKEGYLDKVRESRADGYVLKDSPSDELTFTIRRILEGNQIYSPNLLGGRHEAANDIPLDPGPVKKNYFTMILDKMKHPTG